MHLQGPEYTGLIVGDPDEYEIQKLGHPSDDSPPATPMAADHETEQWANELHRHVSRGSTASERTLFGGGQRSNSSDSLHEAPKEKMTPRAWISKAGQIAFTVLERSLILAGLGMTLTGIVVYTGKKATLARDQRSPAKWLLSRRVQGKLCQRVSCSSHQGCHLLVLRSTHVRPFLGILRRIWMGMEPQPQWFQVHR